MKNKTIGIIQLVLSIILYVLINKFFFQVLGLVGLKFSGLSYEIANFIKYLLISVIVFAIYYRNIRAGQNKFGRAWLNSLIYCVACFTFLVVITVLLHHLLNYIGKSDGIKIPYGFTNYFNQKFTLSYALNLIIEVIFMPFLLCIIFPLGISQVIKKSYTASIVSGLSYAIIYGIMLNTSFIEALLLSVIPGCIILLLTYLYKTNQNIWSVIITYISYILFGIFVVTHIM